MQYESRTGTQLVHIRSKMETVIGRRVSSLAPTFPYPLTISKIKKYLLLDQENQPAGAYTQGQRHMYSPWIRHNYVATNR